MTTADDELEAFLASLEMMPLAALRAEWRTRWGPPPKFRSPRLLRHLIAWRIQAALHGDLTWDDRRRLAAIKRLREAHDAFKPSRPALARQPSRVRSAQAPLIDVGKIDWVFLAPGLQSAILNGRLNPASITRLQDQPSIPLSWADQRRLVESNCA